MEGIRVQKILAQSGIASRRAAEAMIRDGQVTINGKLAKLGDRAIPGKDAIKVNGKLLTNTEAPVYYAFYKPRSVISMLVDPQGRPTIADYLSKIHTRLFPVGRLDFTTEGLLILTNDGETSERLVKSPAVVRVYEVKVQGHPTDADLEPVRRGVKVEGKFLKPELVKVSEDLTKKMKIDVVVRSGGAFDIKALFEARGFRVDRIVRTAVGQIELGSLKPGEFRMLKKSQVIATLDQPELGMWRFEKRHEKKEKKRARSSPRTFPTIAPLGGAKPLKRSSAPRFSPDTSSAETKPQFERKARASVSRPEFREEERTERSHYTRPERSPIARPERSSPIRPSSEERAPRRAFNDRPAARPSGPRPARSDERAPRAFGARPERSGSRPSARPSGPSRSTTSRPDFSGEKPKFQPRSERAARHEFKSSGRDKRTNHADARGFERSATARPSPSRAGTTSAPRGRGFQGKKR